MHAKKLTKAEREDPEGSKKVVNKERNVRERQDGIRNVQASAVRHMCSVSEMSTSE